MRIGQARRIGKTNAVAGYLEVSEAAALRVRERVGLTGAVYDDEDPDVTRH
jgi:N-acyl-L-homoserine lactone synthetase